MWERNCFMIGCRLWDIISNVDQSVAWETNVCQRGRPPPPHALNPVRIDTVHKKMGNPTIFLIFSLSAFSSSSSGSFLDKKGLGHAIKLVKPPIFQKPPKPKPPAPPKPPQPPPRLPPLPPLPPLPKLPALPKPPHPPPPVVHSRPSSFSKQLTMSNCGMFV